MSPLFGRTRQLLQSVRALSSRPTSRGIVTLRKECEGKVSVIEMDDGKMNSFSFQVLSEVNEALNEAESNGSEAIMLTGNSKAFSAGFDLKIMTGEDRNAAADLILKGAEMGLRLYEHRLPIIAASEGHSLAMGAITLLCCDLRIGLDNPKSKIGLNEVSIGMDLPKMAVELARHRMGASQLFQNLANGRVLSPSEAVGNNGYLDEVLPMEDAKDFVSACLKRTEILLANIKQPAYSQIKRGIRGPTIDLLKNTLVSDIDRYR